MQEYSVAIAGHSSAKELMTLLVLSPQRRVDDRSSVASTVAHVLARAHVAFDCAHIPYQKIAFYATFYGELVNCSQV